MKVLEVKNNLVKISSESGDRLILGGFVIIEDDQTPYVGQIVSLKADNGISYAIVRLIFTFNAEGIVDNYNGTIPALDSTVTRLDTSDLLEILPTETPVKLGNLAQQDFMLSVDISLLKNNLLICSDSAKNTATMVMNFAKQLENNAESSVIFDIDGKYKYEKRFVFGENFKLPLNFESINFIYANDLNDVDATSKAVIQDIFLEVQEYTRTIPDKFIPFDTFISVVEQQYIESNIPELALLKNKLLKYREEKVFAQSKYEITSLKEYIKDNYTTILDISMVDPKLQKEIITYVYTVLEEMGAPITTFVKINDENSDKKLIRTLLNESSVYTNLICNHNYKFVYELKEQADNLILFIPETTRHDFASYNTFLNKLNHDEFVVWGKATQRIPFIVELSQLVIKKEEPIRITLDDNLPTPEPVVETTENVQEENENNTTATENEVNAEVDGEKTEETVNAVIVPPAPAVPEEDFTQEEDTYTDLSDDIERVQHEEDYSEIEEGVETVEIPVEDDFDKELDDVIEETLDESLETKEASTNDFFTETNLQETPEATTTPQIESPTEEVFSFEELEQANTKYENVIEEIPNEIPELELEETIIQEQQEILPQIVEQKVTEPQPVQQIAKTRTHVVRDASSKLDSNGVIEEQVPNIITEHRVNVEIPEEYIQEEIEESNSQVEVLQELEQEFINIEEPIEEINEPIEEEIAVAIPPQVEENIIEENSYEEDNFDEDYDDNGEFITSEPILQLDEEFAQDEEMTIEDNDSLILPDPTIDERIEEDLPEVEALFEELPPDVEITPYENTLVQEPAQLIPEENDELIEQIAKEVDETFIYKKIEEESLEEEENLTEDDLNFIDDMNLNEEEILDEEAISENFEQIQATSNSNKSEQLPVYAAKTPTTDQVFKVGDHVAHPKYGEGIVEKLLNHGGKPLCLINFTNGVGRRHLDPAISEITIL